jgi:hypothetical protein
MTNQQEQQHSGLVYLKQENYGFVIADEDDFDTLEERQKVTNLFKQQQEFIQGKMESQRQRWMNTHKSWVRKTNWREKLVNMDWNEIEASKENKELKKLTRKGIPPELRGQIWFCISGANARMKQQSDTNLYNNLLQKHKGQITTETRQVDADIDRTFPHHPYFSIKSTQDSLRNVLYTYSFYNPSIGYCQSMNYIAGVLLLHMSEEQAFWTLDVILRDYLPKDLYDTTMNGLKCEVHVLSELAHDRAPKVSKHLQKLDIDFLLFSTRWFMCLYVNTVPMETAFRIWDAFFVEGYKILFRISVSLLAIMEKEILACNNMGEILKLLTTYPKQLFDCRNIMKSSFKIRRFGRARIEKARKQFRSTLK